MADLNHILLFVASISPLILLARAWQRSGLDRAWRHAAFAVLVVTGVAWILNPGTAGFVGGGAWLVLIAVPSIGLRKIAELGAQHQFGPAYRLARVLRFLHPANGLQEQAGLLRALEIAQQGDFPTALALLDRLRNNGTKAGRQAIIQWFRLRGDWNGLINWHRHALPAEILQSDFTLQPAYLRALGEAGLRNDLLLEFAANSEALNSTPQHGGFYEANLLPVLTFCGRTPAVNRLLETKLRRLSPDTKQYWLGIGQLAAGETSAGRARLEKLRAVTKDAVVRAEAGRALERAHEIAFPPMVPETAALLRRIEQTDRPANRVFASEARPTKAVALFIALNIVMFIAECLKGGSTNPVTLHRLGALEFAAVRFQGEYWRLFTSLFLHYGPLHLAFNLYALFVVGPGLERLIGSKRFTVCYLLSGLGSGLGVLFLRLSGWNSAGQLVGASGCVMGLVGVWAGLLLRHRDSPMAGRRLKNILVIVAIQSAFDLSTPQISMAAHMSGLVTGLALGLVFSPRTLRA